MAFEHRQARIEGGEGILEDHAHVDAARPQLRLAGRREIDAFRAVATIIADRPAGRLVDAQDGAAERGLAAARFADEADRLAFAHAELDAVDRLDSPRDASKQPPF